MFDVLNYMANFFREEKMPSLVSFSLKKPWRHASELHVAYTSSLLFLNKQPSRSRSEAINIIWINILSEGFIESWLSMQRIQDLNKYRINKYTHIFNFTLYLWSSTNSMLEVFGNVVLLYVPKILIHVLMCITQKSGLLFLVRVE